MKLCSFSIFVITLALTQGEPAGYLESFQVRGLRSERECHVLGEGPAQHLRLDRVVLTERARSHDSHSGPPQGSTEKYFELTGNSEGQVREALNKMCPNLLHSAEILKKPALRKGDELIPIIESGAPSNRIDVVFMGDGYTREERDKFIGDIKRLSNDMFTGHTFASYLPLFNIWGFFRASEESGIGANGVPKKTTFGLYRDGTELRGIYPSKPKIAREVCEALKPYQCDYPSLIGNDDFYGGLGGEFVISTRSETSGTIVLRHEMGHNFVKVGEEYDGGYVYDGVNSAPSIDAIGWKHWVTGPLREQRNALRVQDYSWYDLAKGPYNITFDSDGKYHRWYMQLSVSGAEIPNSFAVSLDGESLSWKTSGISDRSFYSWFIERKLAPGRHTLTFTAPIPASPQGPIRQLCSVTLHEYGNEYQYHWDNRYINAYPTFDIRGRKHYRPTNEFCLMRNMSSEDFCSPCQEGLWQSFLSRVSFIDELKVNPEYHPASREKPKRFRFTLSPIKLAQFRQHKIKGEKYTLNWYKNGKLVKRLKNKYHFSLKRKKAVGTWTAELTFQTKEVRKDDDGLLTSKKSVEVTADSPFLDMTQMANDELDWESM
ncbi:hypothetical protein K493DRAFT_310211 [Basidiobolus meristosporus CBS 931.73]|uniref:IgA peptidase M64 n=1 Tax=Basidiobolus meristosporus CBS 931.73 TaxID=1314790 RepID=A0A1Y1ZBY5_9FUNG|nr:hypothetical protein K493DRAFT_310211 [Basidiobolus meristosporus CBS 931.73]|eukprot:ORY07477.1 hypothetical protein K493DRAFT_310211 [Basidiobolus meristosporus CBS 931.73]